MKYCTKSFLKMIISGYFVHFQLFTIFFCFVNAIPEDIDMNLFMILLSHSCEVKPEFCVGGNRKIGTRVQHDLC